MLFFPLHVLLADLLLIQEVEDSKLTQTGPSGQIKIQMSGSRLRLDHGDKISSIIRKDLKTTYSIMHETRQYVVLPHEKVPELKPPASVSTDFKVESTGKTVQINGFECKPFRIVEKSGEEYEVFIAEPISGGDGFYSEFQRFLELGQGIPSPILEKHPELKGIPIQITEFKNSKKIRKATIVKMDTSKLNESVFEVPSGYSELKLKE